MFLDVSLLLSAVSSNSPCGEDLEYDATFLQLARDAEGKPERTMGDAVQPAQPPQWPLVQQASMQLLQRSKDLRIANYLLQSSIALHGISGLAQGLSLIDELLRQYWPSLHPQLDADDNDDATVRINALCAISSDTNLRLLGESSLTRSPVFGSVSLRAAISASGVQPLSTEMLTADELAAALRNSDPEQLRSVHDALSQAHASAQNIERFVSEHVGSAQAVDLSAMKTLLKNSLSILSEFGPDSTRTEFTESVATPSSASPLVQTCPAPSAEISGRDDVLLYLDRVLTYYTRHEPSSPLPVLLNRARALVHADFATIVRNLVPEGLSQLETLRGPEGG
jgi:type VI secretion system protein ImpA